LVSPFSVSMPAGNLPLPGSLYLALIGLSSLAWGAIRKSKKTFFQHGNMYDWSLEMKMKWP
jgi:hypothetical protein